MPIRQHALNVILPVDPSVRSTVASSLEKIEKDVIRALRTVGSLHFGRFVVLGDADDPFFVFESNHDGDREAHLAELTTALAPFEDVLFGAWKGYQRGAPASFIGAHARPATTFYLGHPGLSVGQIKNDDALRRRLDTLLDEAHETGDLGSKSAGAIREALLRGLEGSGFILGPVDRGFPKQPQAKIALYTIVAGLAVAAIGVIPAAFVVERIEERTEPPRHLISEGDPRLDAILAHEDAVSQNGLTHYVPIRPGLFRKNALRLVLWLVEQARQKSAYEGELGSIASIHFARWIVHGDKLLFFSNYDGSWESYLGDFVDKAAPWLTAVWTNTRWFPETTAFIGEGAAREAKFKQWVRTFQVKNQIWYSAYPDLTVTDVLENARIREGAAGPMTEDEARAWLALL